MIVKKSCSHEFMIENVTTALGRKMATMETLLANLESSTDSFGLIREHNSRICNKFILCLENKISIASFISHIYLCMEKILIFFASGNKPDHSSLENFLALQRLKTQEF